MLTRQTILYFIVTSLMVVMTNQVTAEPLIVASKMDTEGALLGNIIADVLALHGLTIDRRIMLGPTKSLREDILAGTIDIYPEYTGNGALFFGDRQSDPAWKDPTKGYELIANLDKIKNHLIWLTPAPANNDWVIAIRNDLPRFPSTHCMGDFARYVNSGGRVKLEGSIEFIKSPAALPAYEDTYGFYLSAGQLQTTASGDTALTLHDAAEQVSGINAAMTYGTDGQISALGLIALCDDKHAQVIYSPAPVIREAVLEAHPEIAAELRAAFAPLTTETLRSLNAEIAVNGEDAATVATSYLRSVHIEP